MTMQRIVLAEMLAGHRLHLRFEDGADGILDLAPLVRRGGVFETIATAPETFRLGPHGRSVAWTDAEGDSIDLCADALRLEMEGSRVAAE